MLANNLFHLMISYHNTQGSVINIPHTTGLHTSIYRFPLYTVPHEFKTPEGATYHRGTHCFCIHKTNEPSLSKQGPFQYIVNFIQDTNRTYQLIICFNESAQLNDKPILRIKEGINPFERHESHEIPEVLLKAAQFSGASILRHFRQLLEEKIQLLEEDYYSLEDKAHQACIDSQKGHDNLSYSIKLDEIVHSLQKIMPLVSHDKHTLPFALTQYVQAALKHEPPSALGSPPPLTLDTLTPAQRQLHQDLNSLQSRFDTLDEADSVIFYMDLTMIHHELSKLFLDVQQKNDPHVPVSLLKQLRQLYCTVDNIQHFSQRLKSCPKITACILDLKLSIKAYCSKITQYSPKEAPAKKNLAEKSLKDIDTFRNIDQFINQIDLNLKNYTAMQTAIRTYLKDITTLYKNTSQLLDIQHKIGSVFHPDKQKPTLFLPRQLCRDINSIAEKYSGLEGIDQCLDDIIGFTTRTETELNYQAVTMRASRPFSIWPKSPLSQAVNTDIRYSKECAPKYTHST